MGANVYDARTTALLLYGLGVWVGSGRRDRARRSANMRRVGNLFRPVFPMVPWYASVHRFPWSPAEPLDPGALVLWSLVPCHVGGCPGAWPGSTTKCNRRASTNSVDQDELVSGTGTNTRWYLPTVGVWRHLAGAKARQLGHGRQLAKPLARCNWPRGPMDKASAYGAGYCRFESCRGHFLISQVFTTL